MILDDDSTILSQVDERVKLYRDLEEAVRYALSEIHPQHRHGKVQVWLSFNFKKDKSVRITPVLYIDTHSDYYDPDSVSLDLNDIYRQIDERFKQESSHGNYVDWDDLILDIYKTRMFKY